MKFDRERYDGDEQYRGEVDHYLATRITNCARCRTKTHAPTVIPRYEAEYTIKGVEVPVVIENFVCRRCTTCGFITVGDEGSKQSEEAYVKAGGSYAFTHLFGIPVMPPDSTQPERTILIEYEYGDKNKRIKRLYASLDTMRAIMEQKVADGNYGIGE